MCIALSLSVSYGYNNAPCSSRKGLIKAIGVVPRAIIWNMCLLSSSFA